ncbi:MAG: hypothetical protein AABX32_02540 [Nanoarchaeota archaeon]
MADNNHPEQAPHGNETQKEQKPKSTLESVINEAIGAAKSGINLGIAALAPATGYVLTGNPGVLANSASFVLGTRGRKSPETIRNESLSGAVFGTFGHYTGLPLRNMTSPLQKLAYMVPWVVGANAFYMGEDYLIKNKSPKGMYKKFKENYWPVVKRAFLLPAPINILSAMFLPQKYFLYTLALATFLFRRFVVKDKGEEQTDKTPYPVAAANVSYKLIRNTTKGLTDTIYAFGKTIDGYLGPSKAAPKSAQPAPAGGEHHT